MSIPTFQEILAIEAQRKQQAAEINAVQKALVQTAMANSFKTTSKPDPEPTVD